MHLTLIDRRFVLMNIFKQAGFVSHLANGSEAAKATASLPFRTFPVASGSDFQRGVSY